MDADRSRKVHLVVLIHGLWGAPDHLAAAKQELETAWAARHGPTRTTARTGRAGDNEVDIIEKTAADEELVIVTPKGMAAKLTYDGIDVCASRVAWEVDTQISQLENDGKRVAKFSVTGYSLGGLVARYFVGLLLAHDPDFFDKHRPVSFCTIATPHLGIPRYNTFLSTVLCWMGGRLLARSGEQLYVADSYSDKDRRPLLEIMADPNLVFYQALEQFNFIGIFANAVKDDTVPYPSAAIEPRDDFSQWAAKGLEVQLDDDGLVTGWELNVRDAATQPIRKRSWTTALGTLPPVLRFRFPYNYIILLFFPILLPVVIALLVARLSLDSSSSRTRLQRLARASSSGASSPGPLMASSSGISVDSLREAIMRVERSLEQPMILEADSNELTPLRGSSQDGDVQVLMTDSQLRMCVWLNNLHIKKYVAWFPEVANSHAVIVVRNPAQFQIHEKGRNVLRVWARAVLA
ncbi:hypothetical protein Q5752_007020 [Cryptotrichosporon argae]